MVCQTESRRKSTAAAADASTTSVIIKFLCSYRGKIAPRSGDGKLRYVGGLTRVFAAHRPVSFSELMVKLGEFCGESVELKCQLPNGDLETLISIKSDEELSNLLEEYDRSCPGSKIRAVLSSPKLLKTVSPPPSEMMSNESSSPSTPEYYRRLSACGYHSPPTLYGKGHYNSPRYPIGNGQRGCGIRYHRICN